MFIWRVLPNFFCLLCQVRRWHLPTFRLPISTPNPWTLVTFQMLPPMLSKLSKIRTLPTTKRWEFGFCSIHSHNVLQFWCSPLSSISLFFYSPPQSASLCTIISVGMGGHAYVRPISVCPANIWPTVSTFAYRPQLALPCHVPIPSLQKQCRDDLAINTCTLLLVLCVS